MHFTLPDWLPTHATPGSVETAVAQAREALRHGEDTIYLTGAGALQAVGAVAARFQGPVIAARLSGCETLLDAILTLGWTLDLPQPGNAHALNRTISALKNPLFLLDARGLPESDIESLRAHLAPAALEARWMIVIETRSAPTNAIGAGMEDKLPEAPAAASLPTNAHAMGWLLAGIPGATDSVMNSRVPGIPRQALFPSSARQLQAASPNTPTEIANELGGSFGHLLPIAWGGAVPDGAVPADLFALRWISQNADGSPLISTAAATAARLALAWGMPDVATEIVERGHARLMDGNLRSQAMLNWAQARIALDTGDRTTARRRFEEAAAALRQSRQLSLLAVATRRWGGQLAARGETAASADQFRDARALYRQLNDIGGVAATLREAGDAAVASGETVSAEALYDQAGANSQSAIEQVNQRISLSTLAIARGEHQRARALLQAAEKAEMGIPLLQANVQRRQADMALREGEHATAEVLASAARRTYARLGELTASARCTRLLGDIAAVQGRLAQAATWFEDAIQTQIRIGDNNGLKRSLTHAAALEQVSGEPSLARELERIAGRLWGAQATR